MNYDPLYEIIEYHFKDNSLLDLAFLHRSKSSKLNYERLEFLGDRILSFCIAKKLYVVFPDDEEGQLALKFTSLVRQQTLAEIARHIGLSDYIQLSYGEQKSGGLEKDSVLSDCCESLIAAIYLDGGIDQADKFINKFWGPYFHKPSTEEKDPRSMLQEIAQKNGKELPQYTVIDVIGAEHEPKYIMQVSIEGYEPAIGEGASKRAAARAAAENLLSHILGK